MRPEGTITKCHLEAWEVQVSQWIGPVSQENNENEDSKIIQVFHSYIFCLRFYKGNIYALTQIQGEIVHKAYKSAESLEQSKNRIRAVWTEYTNIKQNPS